jgi:hypothetical protein
MAGDQFTNSKMLEEKVGVCIEMWRGKEGEMKWETVERRVRMVMKEEKGNRLRQRAAEIREVTLKAVTVASCSTCGIHAEFSIPELVLFEIYQKLLMSGT